jgi:hypothetical protein
MAGHVATEVTPMRKLVELRRDIERLKAKTASNSISFTMKNGTVASITARELGNPDSPYASWIHHNSNPNMRASDSSLLHAVSQSVAGTLNMPFVPFEVFRARSA